MSPAGPQARVRGRGPQDASGAKVGLEVHLYLRTSSKLFCPCPADFLGSKGPNAQVCPRCTAQPGAKPLPVNAVAIRMALRLARALGMETPARARFLRKHYFYPDLPANYQRTSTPIGKGGALAGVALTELHVEEDPGAYDPGQGLVDLDRAGAPLIELVTEPQITGPAHARRFLQELRLVVGYLGIGRDEAGLKADVNVSWAGGERAEVKNVHSLRGVEQAVAHEIDRQSKLVAAGGRVARETRHFDEVTGTTRPSRAKETEADYRYMDDPDVAPVDITMISHRLASEEGPLARRDRLAALAGIAPEEASPLVEEPLLADVFETAASRADARTALQFVVRDLRGELEFRKTTLAAARVAPAGLVELIAALHSKAITPHVATRLLRSAFDGGDLAALLAAESGSAAAGDAVMDAARAAVAQNPKAVADYRAGKPAALNFLVGQAMRALQGRGKPDEVRAAVEHALR